MHLNDRLMILLIAMLQTATLVLVLRLILK